MSITARTFRPLYRRWNSAIANANPVSAEIITRHNALIAVSTATISKPPASTISSNWMSKRKTFHSPKDPTLSRRRIKVFPSLRGPATKDALGALTIKQLAVLDPTGARGKIFSRDNKDAIRVGDIVQVRRKNGEQPFAGVLLNIRRRGVDTGFLLRNQLTRVGVEMWFKLFSPSIEAIDLVQRRAKRSKRAKIYYMRKPTHDMGSVQNIVAQYVRRRAMLRGDGKKDGGKRPGHRR